MKTKSIWMCAYIPEDNVDQTKISCHVDEDDAKAKFMFHVLNDFLEMDDLTQDKIAQTLREKDYTKGIALYKEWAISVDSKTQLEIQDVEISDDSENVLLEELMQMDLEEAEPEEDKIVVTVKDAAKLKAYKGTILSKARTGGSFDYEVTLVVENCANGITEEIVCSMDRVIRFTEGDEVFVRWDNDACVCLTKDNMGHYIFPKDNKALTDEEESEYVSMWKAGYHKAPVKPKLTEAQEAAGVPLPLKVIMMGEKRV